MKAIDLIRWAMQMTEEGTAAIVAELRDAPLTQPTPTGGNHPLWTLGHLAYVEGAVSSILLGEKNPVEHWKPLFGTGTQPSTDATRYPPFDEVLRTYRELRARNLELLDEIGEEGLDRVPKHVPAGFEDSMKTAGHTFLLITLHNMVHYGQVAVARHAAGLKPLM
jgi:hypothetical protein